VLSEKTQENWRTGRDENENWVLDVIRGKLRRQPAEDLDSAIRA